MTNVRFLITILLLSSLAALLAGCVAPDTAPAGGLVSLPTVTPMEASAVESANEAVALPTVTPTTATAAANELPQTAVISAVTAAQQAILDRLSQRTPAPELTNEVWINSEPLQLADLRGQVVIVEFWTYG